MTKVLYHSGPHPLQGNNLEPRLEWTADKKERGHFVFAQPSLVLAHAYAIKTPANFIAGPDKNIHNWYFSIATSERGDWKNGLQNQDGRLGGYIHELSMADFEARPGEWISRKAVQPLSSRFVGVDDVMRSGVQLFNIVDPKKYCIETIQRAAYLPALLMEGVRTGGIEWINKSENIRPIVPPPKPPQAGAKPK